MSSECEFDNPASGRYTRFCHEGVVAAPPAVQVNMLIV
jgi:hypothetical protein